MKQNMMRIAVAATLGLSAFAASAGTIAVNVGATLAAEYVTDAALVAQPTVTFQTTNLLNAGSIVYVHVRFSAGTATAPVAANVTVSNAGTALVPATADADGKGYFFPVTAPATGLPAGTTISIAAAAHTLTGLAAALSNGGTVSTSIGYTSTPGDFAGVTTFIETPTTATVLTSAKALSQVTVTSAAIKAGYFAAAETAKVDVTAAPALTAFTLSPETASTALINLGATKLVVDATKVKPAGGAAAIADFGNVIFTATGDFTGVGVTAPGAVTLNAAENCAGAVTAAGTLSADSKTVTFAAMAPAVAAAPNYLCYATAALAANKVAIPYNIQFAIGGASVAAAATTTASTQTGGNVYFLQSNGAAVFVPSFVPTTGALGSGYNTYLRIVNTGNLTTDITGTGYNQTTGAAGTPAVLKAALAPNASVVLATDAVTNALGLAAGWSSLLVTGSTSNLAVQPLLVNPQGVITNIGAVNSSNGLGANQ